MDHLEIAGGRLRRCQASLRSASISVKEYQTVEAPHPPWTQSRLGLAITYLANVSDGLRNGTFPSTDIRWGLEGFFSSWHSPPSDIDDLKESLLDIETSIGDLRRAQNTLSILTTGLLALQGTPSQEDVQFGFSELMHQGATQLWRTICQHLNRGDQLGEADRAILRDIRTQFELIQGPTDYDVISKVEKGRLGEPNWKDQTIRIRSKASGINIEPRSSEKWDWVYIMYWYTVDQIENDEIPLY